MSGGLDVVGYRAHRFAPAGAQQQQFDEKVATTATAQATTCAAETNSGPMVTNRMLNNDGAERVSAPNTICASICSTRPRPIAASNCCRVARPTKRL